MDITVVGAGHAGLVTGAGLASFGHDITFVDVSMERVAALRSGVSPFFEPGLDDLLRRGVAAGRISYAQSADAAEAFAAPLVFVVVDTPRLPQGEVDLSQVFAVGEAVAPHLLPGAVVVVKSTVPVGTTRQLGESIAAARPGLQFAVAANPEFLREGTAVADFLEPDRIVIGADSASAAEAVAGAHAPLVDRGVPLLVTAIESAELIKYGSNAFLATKLSFINELADLCEASGAVIEEVTAGLGLDERIGPAFLRPGPGFGGACLPKDTHALLHTTREYGTDSRIVAAALRVNEERVGRMVERVRTAGNDGPVALLGITFKANTDDIRESPAVAIAAGLARAGVAVSVHDPRGMEAARTVLPGVRFAIDPYDAARDAAVVVIATEWPEYAALDLDKLRAAMASPVIVDLRNLLPSGAATAAGFRYFPVGRPAG